MKIYKNNYNFFKISFIISILIIFICFAYKIVNFYLYKKEADNSDKLSDAYTLISIYSNDNTNNSDYMLLNYYPVIGKIEIPKLSISYPIISYLTEDYLKIAPCRFYGPLPNEFGNMCIAGHNYDNNKFFSNLSNLQNNDIIKIYDINNHSVLYSVYIKYEVDESNTSVLSQKTNNREITLVTCNNQNKKRIIIKAKETN